ncbi:MAG: c-type cytochrome, partial [Acidobacteria bacterium]|nr:c-type cytochrome [Acidobacteriota bacterium]
FLASTDSWFRPVNFYTGPDGAIYLLDFYHLSIEHPEWTSTHTHHSPDLYKGQDRGRIYRITPAGSLPLAKKIQLGKASDEALVQQLRNPNIWWRRHAQRLLVDRGGDRAVTVLVRLFETADSAVTRVHALWTLEGLGKLDAGLIEKALDDKEAGVRENAIILAESRLPALAPKLLMMENDPDPRVRFQLLATLGFVDSPASRAAQDRLVARDIEDPWVQIAALSASSDRAPQLFETARRLTSTQTDARTALFRHVGAVIGVRNREPEIRRVLTAIQAGAPWWRTATMEGLATGLRGKRVAAGASQDLLVKLFQGSDASVRRASLRLLAVAGLPQNPALAQRAATTAQDRSADADLRADSIGLLALAGRAQQEELFKKLVDPHEPEQVQTAAVSALGRLRGDEIGSFLLERWRAMTPVVRSEAADALLLEPGRSWKLVEAIRNDQVQPWTLSFRQKRALIMHRDVALRDAARPLLEAKAGEREKVLQRYQAALEKNGDAARGKQVFERVCAKCHQFAGLGHEVGPDLGTVRNRSAAMILPEIIIPSRSISQGYEAYVVETKSSGAIEGVIGPQTPSTITIRHEEGKQDVIRRDDIKEMHATNLSAMPEDLDKQVSVEQMADLLKFLKTGR